MRIRAADPSSTHTNDNLTRPGRGPRLEDAKREKFIDVSERDDLPHGARSFEDSFNSPANFLDKMNFLMLIVETRQVHLFVHRDDLSILEDAEIWMIQDLARVIYGDLGGHGEYGAENEGKNAKRGG